MRNNIFYILFFLSCLCFTSCEEPTTNSSSTEAVGDTSAQNEIPPSKTERPVPTSHDCTSTSKTIDDNELFIPEQRVWMTMAADNTTTDAVLGDSYRILEVYNTDDCQLLLRETLPVNASPDFPYFLFAEAYNASAKVICLPGYEFTFCYDVSGNKLYSRLKPAWISERQLVDAQSGMPEGMRAEGPLIIGYARDLGVYAFDVANDGAPTAVLPVAEIGQDGAALFAYGEGSDKQQLVIAYFDYDAQQLQIKRLFDAPRGIDPAINNKIANNRYIVLKEASGSHIAIDMEQRALIELPDDIASQSVQDILKYVRRPK